MSKVARIFRRFVPQLFHMIFVPIFYFAFILIYTPFNTVEFYGGGWFATHLAISASILMMCMIITRLAYYYIPLAFDYALYIVWCFLEMIFASFFMALHIWLVLDKPIPYFEAFAIIFQYLAFTVTIVYVIIGLSLRLNEYQRKQYENSSNNIQRVKFYDQSHNLKIILTSDAILYIAAEENYVNIFYQENERVKTYQLRSSMKALDKLCQDSGLVRCHRSYYVNPSHVKVLRKDKDGIVRAELDVTGQLNLPVTKRYYDSLSELL